jgi:hypothetical protein
VPEIKLFYAKLPGCREETGIPAAAWPFRPTDGSSLERGFLINGQPMQARRLYHYPRAWRARILNLLMELQTRKLVERGKRIVQWELGLSEHEALLVLQRQSQQRMKAIILSAEVRQSIATD